MNIPRQALMLICIRVIVNGLHDIYLSIMEFCRITINVEIVPEHSEIVLTHVPRISSAAFQGPGNPGFLMRFQGRQLGSLYSATHLTS